MDAADAHQPVLPSAVEVWEANGDVPRQLPRHRHGLSRGTVRASQELRVMTATVEIVAERGYGLASIRLIATRAGISTKTFYELYPDKEAAFLATYAAVDTVVGLMRVAVAAAPDAPGVVRASIETYLATLASEPIFARTLVIEAVATTDRIRARRALGLADFATVLVDGLRRVRGPVGPDPVPSAADRALVIGALGGVNELVVQHLGTRDAESLLDVAPAAQELLERIVLTPTERGLPGG